jgi:hypothetical protein
MGDNKNRGLSDVYEDGKKYFQNRLEYAELSALNRGSRVFANLITEVTVILFFLLAFLFGSVTLGFYLASLFDSYTAGFGVVAAFYLLIATIVYLTKDKYIERIIIDKIIKKYFDGAEKDNK